MTAVVRMWTALAALGAGIVHFGVAAGAPPLLLAVFSLLGAAELAWAALVLVRGRLPLRRVALSGALLGPLLWAGSLFLAAPLGVTVGNLPPAALAAATLLDAVLAVVLALSLRRHPAGDAPAGEPRAAILLAGIAVGAVAMTGVALPALASTQAGIAAFEGPHNHSGPTSDEGLTGGGHSGH
ncbi:MAG TPA: hypothetical protein VIL55_06225 [Naasia sp.]